MRCVFAICCARAANGQAAAALPSVAMNSRRFINCPPTDDKMLAHIITCASQQEQTVDVRFGSKADIGAPSPDVRFTPKSGHPAPAISGGAGLEHPSGSVTPHSNL